jgi:uncharacterized membrane protein
MLISFPIVVLSSAGLVASGYIWYKQVTSGPVWCVGRGCAAVIRSRYGRLLGFPNGVWGTVYFGGLLVAAGLVAANPAYGRILGPLSLLASSVALVLHAYLTYLQIFVLRALCSWCLTSAALTLALALLLIQGFVVRGG